MNCGACTKAFDNDSVFCRFCGTPVDGFSEDKILPTLFAQITDELRSRRQAEYVYTGAALGSFGAVAWGVAALVAAARPSSPKYWLFQPPIVAALGSLVVAVAVIFKICADHGNYAKLMTELGKYSKRVAAVFHVDYLSKDLTEAKAGPGYRSSIYIVIAGALLAIAFSLSVWWTSR